MDGFQFVSDHSEVIKSEKCKPLNGVKNNHKNQGSYQVYFWFDSWFAFIVNSRSDLFEVYQQSLLYQWMRWNVDKKSV